MKEFRVEFKFSVSGSRSDDEILYDFIRQVTQISKDFPGVISDLNVTEDESTPAAYVVRTNKDIPLPEYQTPDSAGMDLHAAIENELTLLPNGGRAVIPTGIRLAIPRGYEMQIRPRSGLAAKHGVTVINSPGTIDSDYRAEVGVILINHGDTPYTITRGDRIAQAIFSKTYKIELIEKEELDTTTRGNGGFGSTGK